MKTFNILIKQYIFYCLITYFNILIVLSVEKKTDSKNPKFVKTKKGRIMVSSLCLVSNCKKSRFIKNKEASGLLSSLGTKTFLRRSSFVLRM